MSKEEIHQRFENENSANYIERSMNWLPEEEYVMQLVIDFLRHAFGESSGRILDLGAGTGRLARHILGHFDKLKITLMDFSANMIKAVPEVLQNYNGRYRTICADFFNACLGREQYNAVVSSFAIHHGRNEETYLNLYKNIHETLMPGGIFLCLDVIDGDNTLFAEFGEVGWTSFLEKQDFQPDDIETIMSNYHTEDSPVSLNKHFELLKAAGFNQVDILWKKYNFGVYVGVK